VDIVPYLSAVILVTTVATILLAVLSYAAFKLRDKRKPKANLEKPVFFHRYRLEGEDAAACHGGDAGPGDGAS
jgi:hypothetical protein